MISYIPYDDSEIDFSREVNKLFFSQYPLCDLHLLSTRSYKELFEIGKDSSTEFHLAFYDQYRAGWPIFELMYERFIKDVVSAQFAEDFLYQKFPTFRVHLIDNVAVGAFHCDSEFGHPDGEINFIIPLTDSQGTASLWVESEEGRKDFAPVKLQVGWLVKFNGNKLTHGNKVNLTGKTRVSMDFRVLPLSKYDEKSARESVTTKTKFVEGEYFKRFKK